MAVDTTPEEPYVHPNQLGDRASHLMVHINGFRADMEEEPVAATAGYFLAVQRLLELMPLLLEEHRRMAAMVTRDPRACTAVFLGCDRLSDDPHEDHFEYCSGTRWKRTRNGHELTYEGFGR